MNTSARRWRTVDIVIAAVLAVAFGVIFWFWDYIVWNGAEAFLAFYPPLKAVVYGMWMMPAVIAPLILRKPGAAIFTEGLAATVSALMGAYWGIATIWQGLAQGAGGELPFFASRYTHFGPTIAMIAGATSGLVATVWDAAVYYPTLDFLSFQLPYVLIGVFSSLLIAGIGSTYLTRALAKTGVLDRFPAGRERSRV